MSSNREKPELVQAALSHLELALANLQDKVRLLPSDERSRLFHMAEFLKQLSIDDVSRQDSEPFLRVPQEGCIRHPSQHSQQKGPSSVLDYLAGRQPIGGSDCIDLESFKFFSEQTPVTTSERNVVVMSVEAGTSPGPENEDTVTTLDLPKSVSVSENWLRDKFLEIFDELDKDGQGTISHKELRTIFLAMGLPEYRATKIFQDYDASGDGLIDRTEWLQVVEHFQNATADADLLNFLQSLAERKEKFGHVYHDEQPPMCMLLHNSRVRVAWDLFMMFLLAYLTFTLPLSFAFGEDTVIRTLDFVVDVFFLIDVVLNFRTSYVSRSKEEIIDPRRVACHYAKGWFILDLVSTIPLDRVVASGVVPNSSCAKLLKVGKIAKGFKMLRMSKLVKMTYSSEIFEDVEEFIWSNHCHALGRLANLMFQLILCGHWFACLLIAIDGPSLKLYFPDFQPSAYQKYIAAMYWSMMTMTTVGYGDVLMASEEERVFAVVAMVFGGSLYGYVIGSITALVSQHDLNRRAFKDRMDLIMSWLDFHEELPKTLRRRVWRHFKDHLSKRTAIDDGVIMNDLPVSLKEDVIECLMHDDVRHNPLFEDLTSNELGRVVTCLERISVQPEEIICEKGTAGTAMFIITQGTANFTEGSVPGKPAELCSGDSFGEEVLLRLNQQFCYTIRAETKMDIFKLSVDAFEDALRESPNTIKRMESNFLASKDSTISRSMVDKGRASILQGGSSGVPPSFPDAVFDALNDVAFRIDKLMQRRSLSSAARVSTPMANIRGVWLGDDGMRKLPSHNTTCYSSAAIPVTTASF